MSCALRLALCVLLAHALARAQSPGDLDTSFNPGTGADWRVLGIARQSDGKFVVAGQFNTFNGLPRNRITRLNVDGSTDLSFDPGKGADSTINAVAVAGDGKILVGGDFYSFDGQSWRRLARLTSGGTPDPTFAIGSGADGSVQAVLAQADGKVLLAGGFTAINGIARNRIARLNADGSLDAGFNPGSGANAPVLTLALQDDGKILLGGYFSAVDGVTRHRVARLNSDGSLDTSFVPGTVDNGYVNGISPTSDGKVFVAGGISVGIQSRLIRLLPGGGVDHAFNPGNNAINSDVTSVIAQSDGKVLLAGYFTAINGVSRNGVARMNSDGSLDPAFDPGAGANQLVWTMVLQPDGRLVAGGAFTTYGGVSRNRLTRIHNDGATANQAPQMAAIGSLTILEDSGSRSVTVTGITPGPAGETAQSVTNVTAVSSNPSLIPNPGVTYTPGATTATLAFTPAANANGSVTLSVVAQDNGGTANGGVDRVTNSFTITVTAVNDAPSFSLSPAGRVVAWPTETWLDMGQTSVPAAALSGVTAVAGGWYHSLALTSDGSVLAWGNNWRGEIDVPAQAQSGVVAIAAGNSFSLALKADGTVVAWGNNDNGELDKPADLAGVTAIAAGENHSLALKSDGTVVTWGRNTSGQLAVPAGLNNVVAIAAGSGNSLALKQDGTVVGWGMDWGRFVGETNLVAIGAFDERVLGLRRDGTLVANGLFAADSSLWSETPSNVVAIALGADHALALRSDGTLLTANAGSAPLPAQTGVVAISAGESHSLVVRGGVTPGLVVGEDSGSQTAAGAVASAAPGPANESVQLVSFLVANDNAALFSSPPAIAANGTLTFTPAPNATGTATVTVRAQDNGGTANGGVDMSAPQTFTITVTPVNDAPTLAAIGVSGREDTTLAFTAANFTGAYSDAEGTPLASIAVLTLPASGILKLSGTNVTPGQMIPAADLGNLTYVPAANENGAMTFTVTAFDGSLSSTVTTVTMTLAAVNDAPSFTLNLGATLLGWGRNDYGQTVAPPEAQGGIIAFDAGGTLTLVLKRNGQVLAWGDNTFGQADVPLAAQSGVTAISTHGHHNLALKANGSVVAWGRNEYGQTNVPPEAASDVTAVAAGLYHSVALKANGSVVAWGRNEYGQTSVPPEVASGVIAIAAGWDHTLALKDNGSVVAWGNATVANVPVDAQSGVIAVASGMYHALALKANGSVVAWGRNSDGQANVPASALSGVIAIAGGGYHSLALKDTGAVVAWGRNTHGATTVPPAAGSGVVAIAAGGDHSLALVEANNLTVAEDAGAQTIPFGIVNISPGPANESLQVVNYIVANNNPALFSSPPAFDSAGTLTYTPAPNANGSATVTVYAQDTGGVLDGGDDASDSQTFTITVTPVNDAPLLVAIGISGTEDTTLAFTAANFTGAYSDVEGTPLASITVVILPTSGTLKLSGVDVTAGQVIPVADLGNLTYVPAEHENGAKTFTVTASDGSLSSAVATVMMTLTAVNDAPSFVLPARVAPIGPWTVATIAGTAMDTGSADGTGAAARFNYPHGMVMDGAGTLYVTDNQNHTIRKITPDGVVTTWAGLAGSAGTADGPVALARFNQPLGVGIDSAGNLYVADSLNHTIRKITPAGVVSTLAGLAGNTGTVDGAGSTARFNHPAGLTLDSAGNLYVTDSQSHTVRKITSDGAVTTLAGQPGVAGTTDGLGAAARLNTPIHLATDSSGNMYVADLWNHAVRKIAPDGMVTTLAGLPGTSNAGSTDGPAASARFYHPAGVAVDRLGSVYVADHLNYTIRLIAPDGMVSTLAGLPGVSGGADGIGSVARFYRPSGLVVTEAGDLYVADVLNSTIRRLSPAVAASASLMILEDAGAQTIGAFATGISPGPADESAQAVSFAVTSDNNALFALGGQSAISAAGTLTFTPTLNAYGSATVTVLAVDNGGLPGVDTSAPQTFTLTVTPVNDPPSFTFGSEAVTNQTVLAWGGQSQTSVPTGLTGVTAVAVSYSHTLALKGDGTVSAWGDNAYGRATVPAGLTGVTAVAAGYEHSLAIRGNGTVVGWGNNYPYAQATPPAGLSGVTAIAAGRWFNLALKSDGTVVEWGYASSFETGLPPGLNGVTAIAAGFGHRLALKSDGTVVAWGATDYGVLNVPPGLSGVIAIAAGDFHSLALKNDGTVVAWGNNSYGQAAVPTGLTGVTRVAAGGAHSLALLGNGRIVGWGLNNMSQTTHPSGGSGVTVISAGGYSSVAVGDVVTGSPFAVTVQKDSGSQTVPNAAVNVSAGPPDEAAQVVSFTVTNNNNALFAPGGQPAIDGSGTLTFTPASGAAGLATVTVVATDNGGTANGGVDASGPRMFVITVASVKVFVSGSPVVVAGDSVNVPISLAGDGIESGVAFTLTYDRPRLTLDSVTVESGSDLSLNWNEPSGGQMNNVGIVVTKPAGTTFSAGTNVMLRVTFRVPFGTAATNTPIGFSSAVVVQQVSDVAANPIPHVLYVPGIVTITTLSTLEGDVSPRPAGSGAVTVSDAVQIGLFAAGINAITDFGAGSEFQRADCAPRSSRGDGQVTLIDWVQALRYAAGLDPATPAGGPTMQAASLATSSARLAAGTRVVRVVGGNLFAGRANTVSVQLDAQGNEAGVSLSLGFDPTAMTFVSATVGNGAAGASLMMNNAKAAAGRVGLVLVMPAGTGIAAGTRDLITLTFNVTGTGITAITLSGDSPVAREIADVSANVLGAGFVGGNFNLILPPGLKAAGLERATDGSLRLVVVNTDGSPVMAAQAARYQVFVTSDLGGAWTLLPDALVIENGALKIVDPAASGAGLRLYKLIELSP